MDDKPAECGTCRWWVKHQTHAMTLGLAVRPGDCRGAPPLMLLAGGNAQTMYPIVPSNYPACRVYEEREPWEGGENGE